MVEERSYSTEEFKKILAIEVTGNQSARVLVALYNIIKEIIGQWYFGISSKIRIFVGYQHSPHSRQIVLPRSEVLWSFFHRKNVARCSIQGEILDDKMIEKLIPELCGFNPKLELRRSYDTSKANVLKDEFQSHFEKDEKLPFKNQQISPSSRLWFDEEVKLEELIGKGISGDVYKAQWRRQTVAIKILLDGSSQSDERLSDLIVDGFCSEVSFFCCHIWNILRPFWRKETFDIFHL